MWKDTLNFAGDHPVVAVLVVWSIAAVLKMPFWAINRYLRSRNIARHGWPTAPVDADGDVVYQDKKEAA